MPNLEATEATEVVKENTSAVTKEPRKRTPRPTQVPVYQVKKAVTLNQIKMVSGQPVYVMFTSSMYESDKVFDKKLGKPTLINCVNLVTNNEFSCLVVSSVLEAELNSAYTEDSYVGKQFVITRQPKPQGKDYFPVEILEIECQRDENDNIIMLDSA